MVTPIIELSYSGSGSILPGVVLYTTTLEAPVIHDTQLTYYELGSHTPQCYHNNIVVCGNRVVKGPSIWYGWDVWTLNGCSNVEDGVHLRVVLPVSRRIRCILSLQKLEMRRMRWSWALIISKLHVVNYYDGEPAPLKRSSIRSTIHWLFRNYFSQ